MEEKLIEFETAKLAKEKGFNIPCDGRWWIEPASSWKFSKQGVIKCDNSMDSIARPTQSLLQKWLREVHKIHVDIKEWEMTNWYFYLKDGRTSPVKNIRIKIDDDTKWEFDSYEDALEVGLLEGLKLIEL